MNLSIRDLFLPAFIFLSSVTLYAQSGITFFEGSWKGALKKAKKENKPLFIDCYTVWCGPCKWMVKNVFPNDTAGTFYNANFINYKIDMEKGEGPTLEKKYDVNSYPTYLFVDANGTLLHRKTGSMSVQKFIAEGQIALNPSQRLDFIAQKYESGDNSLELIEKYAAILQDVRSFGKAKEVVRRYLAQFDESKLIEQDNWNLVKEYCYDYSDKEYAYILKNKQTFVEKYGDDATNYLYSGALNEMELAGRNKDEALFQNLLIIISDCVTPDNQERSFLNAHKTYYHSAKQWEEYAAATVKYMDAGYYKVTMKKTPEMEQWLADMMDVSYDEFVKQTESSTLNGEAWNFYEHVEETALLQKAITWVELSIQLEETYYNLDTYAALLYKTGNSEKAIQIAQKAIKLATENGNDYSSTEDLIKKYGQND